MDTSISTEDQAPVVKLIGILLLIAGITGIFSGLYKLNLVIGNRVVEHLSYEKMSIVTDILAGLGLLLAVATIISGAGLRRQTLWAQRTAVSVLCSNIVFPIVSNPLDLLLNHMHIPIRETVHTVVMVLPYAVMLLFLCMPYSSTDDPEQHINGWFSRLAARVRNTLPDELPTVANLITLLLLCNICTVAFFMKGIYQKMCWISAIHDHFRITLLIIVNGLFILGALCAGVGMFRRAAWAWTATYGMLIFAFLQPMITFFPPVPDQLWSFPLSTIVPFFAKGILYIGIMSAIISGNIMFLVMANTLCYHRPRQLDIDGSSVVDA